MTTIQGTAYPSNHNTTPPSDKAIFRTKLAGGALVATGFMGVVAAMNCILILTPCSKYYPLCNPTPHYWAGVGSICAMISGSLLLANVYNAASTAKKANNQALQSL